MPLPQDIVRLAPDRQFAWLRGKNRVRASKNRTVGLAKSHKLPTLGQLAIGLFVLATWLAVHPDGQSDIEVLSQGNTKTMLPAHHPQILLHELDVLCAHCSESCCIHLGTH